MNYDWSNLVMTELFPNSQAFLEARGATCPSLGWDSSEKVLF